MGQGRQRGGQGGKGARQLMRQLGGRTEEIRRGGRIRQGGGVVGYVEGQGLRVVEIGGQGGGLFGIVVVAEVGWQWAGPMVVMRRRPGVVGNPCRRLVSRRRSMMGFVVMQACMMVVVVMLVMQGGGAGMINKRGGGGSVKAGLRPSVNHVHVKAFLQGVGRVGMDGLGQVLQRVGVVHGRLGDDITGGGRQGGGGGEGGQGGGDGGVGGQLDDGLDGRGEEGDVCRAGTPRWL